MRPTIVCIIALLIGQCTLAGTQQAPCCAAEFQSEAEKSPLEHILDRMQRNAAELVSFTSKLEYLFIDSPDLLDSHMLRKGHLYYLKDQDRSQVRINFDTLKQDDFDEEQRREIYLFDGVWLTKVDYALEQIDKYQQAPEDEPIDALDFISHHFPMIGFSGSKQFESQFDVKLAKDENDEDPNLVRLVLDVKDESRYSKDYEKIDFWIDKKMYLPRRVRAYSTLGDIYDIRFIDIQTNKKPEKQLFSIETPAHFSQNTEPLKQEPQSKGQN